MPTHQEAPAPTAVQLRGVVDLPLVAEQLQDQLDDLRAVAQAQQRVLERLAARVVLERR